MLCFNKIQKDQFKLNKIFNKFLLVADNFMQKLHLRQPRFAYSACGTFAKHHEMIEKLKEKGDLNYVYKNGLDKACFGHDSAYERYSL